MLYYLHNSVFASEAYDDTIDYFLHKSIRQRLYLLPQSINSVEYRAWRRRKTEQYLLKWDVQCSWTEKDLAFFRLPAVLVQDVVQTSDWNREIPILTINDSEMLSEQVFKILLENGANDRAFLLAVANEDQYDFLKFVEEKGILEFDHAGGIGSANNMVRNLRNAPQRRLLYWVLFDSDAPVPDEVSPDAARLIATCEEMGVGCLCLSRRSIENYLPTGALYDYYVNNVSNQKTQRSRREKVDAFKGLSDAQRHHFHMKRGFEDESCRKSPIYISLSEQNKTTLKSGIHADIADIYHNADRERLRLLYDRHGDDSELRSPLNRVIDMFRIPYAR